MDALERFEKLALEYGASHSEIDYIKLQMKDCDTAIVFTSGQFNMLCRYFLKDKNASFYSGNIILFPKNAGLEIKKFSGPSLHMELLYLTSAYFKVNVGPMFINEITDFWEEWIDGGSSKLVLMCNNSKKDGGYYNLHVFEEKSSKVFSGGGTQYWEPSAVPMMSIDKMYQNHPSSRNLSYNPLERYLYSRGF